jgi:excisionase family DNA binding protein
MIVVEAPPMAEEYLTVEEVAQRLKVTKQAIYNWINEGKLRAVKAGRSTRIPVSAVDAFLRPYVPSERDEEQAQP